jgi:hypothetical protein
VASLGKTFPQAFLEVLHHLLQHVGRNCCHFIPDVQFQIHHCSWFLFIHLALEISPEEEGLELGTLILMNIEVPTKYQLSHNDRIVVFENCLHSKSPMLYRPALHGNRNALSLARRALKDKFPMLTFQLTALLPNHQVFLPDPICTCWGSSRLVWSPLSLLSDECCELYWLIKWLENEADHLHAYSLEITMHGTILTFSYMSWCCA